MRSDIKAFNTLHTNASVVAGIDPFRASFSKPADKNVTLTLDLKGMMDGHMRGMGTM